MCNKNNCVSHSTRAYVDNVVGASVDESEVKEEDSGEEGSFSKEMEEWRNGGRNVAPTGRVLSLGFMHLLLTPGPTSLPVVDDDGIHL